MGSIATKLAAANATAEGKKAIEELVPEEYLSRYRKVFEKGEWDSLPPRRKWDHAIELIPGAEPFKSKLYPLSIDEQKDLDKFIEEHLQTGRIRPSKSPIASPFFFVKKKDGSLRPVQDYRYLNSITIRTNIRYHSS